MRRPTAALTIAALTITASACSIHSSATPTAAHHRATLSTRPAPATVPGPTTTLPSATPTTRVAPVARPAGWTGTLTSLPPGGGFTSLSCISDTFCIAAGGGANEADALGTTGSGVTVSWDGASWSNPSVYYPAPAAGPIVAPMVPSIACTGGPFCVIVDGSGHVSTGDGTNWSAPAQLNPGPPMPANPTDPGPGHPGARGATVSCPASNLCVAVDNTGHAYTFHDGSWLATQSFGATAGGASPNVSLYQAGRVGLACPTTSSCTAVVGTSVLDWNGNGWTEEPAPWTTSLTATTSGTAIACPTSDLCAIVNGTGLSVRTAGKGWSPVVTIDPQGGLDSITCPTTSFCLAADAHGSVLQWNGGSWSAPSKVIPASTEYTGDPTTVSCPNDRFCMVMNGDGDYATYTAAASGPVAAPPTS